MNEPRLFTGTSTPDLAKSVAAALDRTLDPLEVTRFSDGELRVEVGVNVRRSQCFIIHSTCAPANDTLMELMLMADALKRSSAQEIVAVIPYFGYARQDRRPGYDRVPISASVVAHMLQGVGINHIITCDLHATQIQGFFNIAVDNISASKLFVDHILNVQRLNPEDIVVVSPDTGGVARARQVAKHLENVELAIIDKRRPKANISEVMNIIGDVRGKTCIIVDDMVDTAGTLGKAADALVRVGGANRVIAYATHGVLSGKAAQNLNNSALERLIVTDTIPLAPDMSAKVSQISIAPTLAHTVRRSVTGESIRELLFDK